MAALDQVEKYTLEMTCFVVLLGLITAGNAAEENDAGEFSSFVIKVEGKWKMLQRS